MQWYYAHNNEQLGPVMEEEFRELVSRGVVTPDTLVWNDSMSDWQPYATVQFAGAAATAGMGIPYPTGQVECVQCKNYFPEEDTIAYQDVHVCAACKPFFFQSLREGGHVPGQLRYAGFWIRFVAKIVDGLIYGIPIWIIYMALFFSLAASGPEDNPGTFLALQGFLQIFAYVALVLYNGIFIGKFAATPGKMLCGLKVVRADGDKVTLARGFGRAGGEIISNMLCSIGYIIAAFDDQKRTLHDYMCDTRVIYK